MCFLHCQHVALGGIFIFIPKGLKECPASPGGMINLLTLLKQTTFDLPLVSLAVSRAN